jgi:hypothetical protein
MAPFFYFYEVIRLFLNFSFLTLYFLQYSLHNSFFLKPNRLKENLLGLFLYLTPHFSLFHNSFPNTHFPPLLSRSCSPLLSLLP